MEEAMAIERLFAISAVLIGAMAGTPAWAQDGKTPEAKPNQIQIEYLAPKDKDFNRIYEQVKERQMLEKFQAFLSPLKLREPLMLRFQDCDGDSNAWYEKVDGKHSVTVCYEYIAEQVKNAPKKATPAGITHEDAIVGPSVEVFLHEVGHAVFALLDIPVFGREEDAADQFAAFIMLTLGRQEARRLIGGVAFMYVRDAREESRQLKKPSKGMQAYANEHGFAAQRLYNLLCIAYGAYPDVFQD